MTVDAGNLDSARWGAAYDYWSTYLQTGSSPYGGAVGGFSDGDILMPGGQRVPASNALDYYTNLYLSSGQDKEDYYRIADLLVDKGYMSSRADISSYEALVTKAVYVAGNDKFRGKLNPVDVLELLPDSGSNPDGSPRSFSTTSRTVTKTSKTDAKATLNNAYQQMLGRMATDKELAVFQKALNDMEAKNPSVSVSSGTSTTKGGNTSTSSSTNTTGGFNSSQFAADFARSRPEYAEVFAATTFMNVIDDMVRGGATLEGRVQ